MDMVGSAELMEQRDVWQRGKQYQRMEGIMSACSLTADLLSKCTWNVPFTNVWVQEIVDTAVATRPVCDIT